MWVEYISQNEVFTSFEMAIVKLIMKFAEHSTITQSQTIRVLVNSRGISILRVQSFEPMALATGFVGVRFSDTKPEASAQCRLRWTQRKG